MKLNNERGHLCCVATKLGVNSANVFGMFYVNPI